MAVDPHGAGADAACHLVRQAQVLGPYRRGQAVDGVIGPLEDRVNIGIGERNGHTTGPKISSCTTFMPGLVLVKTVGRTKYPRSTPDTGPPAEKTGFAPRNTSTGA